MRTRLKIALLLTGLIALAAVPALALAQSGEATASREGPSYETAPPPLPGPAASQAEKARAYGRYCKGQSKKHVKGQIGTPFSQCVTAMAKAATNKKLPAQKACTGLSKEHVKGQKGTSFSRCVVGVNELRQQNKRVS